MLPHTGHYDMMFNNQLIQALSNDTDVIRAIIIGTITGIIHFIKEVKLSNIEYSLSDIVVSLINGILICISIVGILIMLEPNISEYIELNKYIYTFMAIIVGLHYKEVLSSIVLYTKLILDKLITKRIK